jgi:alpha-tubulin suppressor-like RCC1 family protein
MADARGEPAARRPEFGGRSKVLFVYPLSLPVMTLTARWFLAVAASAFGSGCSAPRPLECTVRCGPAGACPAGTTCGADSFCHQDLALVCAPTGDGGTAAGPDDAAAPPSGGWRAISTGAQHTCGISGEALYCWGEGEDGRLGAGDNAEPAPLPRRVPGAWKAVAAGGRHTCAIRSDGTLWCWGSNQEGQLGGFFAGEERHAPTMTGGPTSGWTEVSAGGSHTCALRGGELWCWGGNASGQLGIDSAELSAATPTRVGATADFQLVAAGTAHTCALRSGALTCWGDSGRGRLGSGLLEGPVRAMPATPIGEPGARWRSVAAGASFTCAVRAEGGRWCWGANDLGQLGCAAGSTCAGLEAVWEPMRTDDHTDWQGVTAGGAHGCGRRGDAVVCWGANDEGQSGQPIATPRVAAAPVRPSPGPLAAVAAGGAHTCALAADGSAWCWGSASQGQLGEGSISDRDLPAPVAGGRTWRSVSAGWGAHACGVDSEGGLHCWGAGDRLQLGGPMAGDVALPRRVEGTEAWTMVDVGLDFACGLSALAVHCWGSNENGEAGAGPANQPGAGPRRIDDGGESNWAALAVGRRHACGIRAAGAGRTLWCWGANDSGQAGGAAPAWNRPTQVGSADDWNTVDAGDRHSCGLRGTGDLWCWGGGALAPVPIGSGGNFEKVAVGGETTCTIRKDSGQLSCGANTDSGDRPVGLMRILDGAWFAVAGGRRHMCAFTMAGLLVCWGANGSGQLGLGDALPRSDPRPVLGKRELWLGVSAGDEFSCGRSTTGGFCWGRGHRGQLGTGHHARPQPAPVMGP